MMKDIKIAIEAISVINKPSINISKKIIFDDEKCAYTIKFVRIIKMLKRKNILDTLKK